MQLEEGEIEDDSGDGLNPYTPLERPHFIHATPNLPKKDDTESDEKYSSDSDEDLKPKRPKMRKINTSQPKRSKYSIWCKDPNEHLTDFLDSFGMRNPENDRNVENYTVPNAVIMDRKRKRPVRRGSDSLESEKLTPISLDELEISELNSFEEVATDISTKLKEPNYDLVLRIVIIIGKEKAIEFYNKTREIEQDGGMLIANRSRRRTSGGVFILLVRNDKDISRTKKNEIFEEWNSMHSMKRNQRKKKVRDKKLQLWMEKMSDEKGLESGQEEINNPPPSPESHSADDLPVLPLRRDIVSYSDINLSPSHSEFSQERVEIQKSSPERKPFTHSDCGSDRVDDTPPAQSFPPNELSRHSPSSASPLKRNVVEYDDLCSMDLIYD